jgi:ElaB/YqjD/DUF883 family membrane-anchored ribosome-binding protein
MSQLSSAPSKEYLLEEIDSILADTAQLLKGSSTTADGLLESGKATVADGLAAAGARLAKIRDESIYQARAAVTATDRYVQANPWRTAGIVATVSALAGLAAGMLIARR